MVMMRTGTRTYRMSYATKLQLAQSNLCVLYDTIFIPLKVAFENLDEIYSTVSYQHICRHFFHFRLRAYVAENGNLVIKVPALLENFVSF